MKDLEHPKIEFVLKFSALWAVLSSDMDASNGTKVVTAPFLKVTRTKLSPRNVFLETHFHLLHGFYKQTCILNFKRQAAKEKKNLRMIKHKN